MASDPNTPQIVYFGSQDCGNVFRSVNSGETWIKINPAVAAPQCWVDEVRDVAVDKDSRVYAATSEGLLRWQGSAWQSLTGLPTDDITAIAIDLSAGAGTLYVGTGENGVYGSSDGGDTWLPFNRGLSGRAISGLVVGPAFPRMLYAGMEYGGVWGRSIGEAYFSYLPMIRAE